MWPASAPVPSGPWASGETAAQGYNVVHWRDGGMIFWAVTDAERAQLADFAALWKAP